MASNARHRSVGEIAPGMMAGEYRLEAKLGEGGFGTVYRAIHPVIGKRAAIKVLAPQFSSKKQFMLRFIGEARAVNTIRHRNIVDIFSFGILPTGHQYFAMELLEGMTLAQYLGNGPLPLPHALLILRQVGRALDAAHAAGIAHCDLKPDNIFLTFDEDGAVVVKLLDFGIAKLLGASRGEESSVTLMMRAGTSAGTPLYMSPEQCQGLPLDHRTDVYSFGVLAYEMLTGRPPFEGKDLLDVLIKHIHAPPPPVSQVCPGLPAQLDAPLLRMLAKSPSERPVRLADALHELDAGGVRAPVASFPLRAPPRRPSHALRGLMIGVSLAAAVAATVAVWSLPPHSRTPLVSTGLSAALAPSALPVAPSSASASRRGD